MTILFEFFSADSETYKKNPLLIIYGFRPTTALPLPQSGRVCNLICVSAGEGAGICVWKKKSA